jgi:hypothetical protein
MSRQVVLSLLLFAASVPAQTVTAHVNDTRSHGVQPDPFLSLDEAIRLLRGDLQIGNLSPGEFGQITGFGSVIDSIEVDARVTPVITYEGELSVIVPPSHIHTDITMRGVTSTGGPLPVLDATGRQAAIPVSTNHLHLHNFVVRGAALGIQADPIGHYHPGSYLELRNVTFQGQTTAAVSITNPNDIPGRNMPAVITDVRIDGAPVGVQLNDLATNGSLIVNGERITTSNVPRGLVINVQAIGGISSVEFYRSNLIACSTCIEVQRGAASDSEMLVRFVHGTYTATHNVLDVTGNAAGSTIAHTHNLVMRSGTGASDYAMLIGPRTGRFDIHGSENKIDGSVSIAAGRTTRRIWQQNNQYRNGTFTLDNEGILPDFQWNHYESYPLVVAALNRTTVNVTECEMHRSSVTNLSTFAAVNLTRCLVDSASPLTGTINNNSPLSAPWIGRASVSPLDPTFGGSVDMTVDLPPGMGGLWLISRSIARPQTTNFPYRFYFEIPGSITLPVLQRNQDRLRLQLPSDPALVGIEIYAQPLNLALLGQPGVPFLTMPAGAPFVMQP